MGDDEDIEVDTGSDLDAAVEQENLPGSDTGDPSDTYVDTEADTSGEGYGSDEE